MPALLALFALAACGTQTSGSQAADDPTPSAPTTSASPSESVEPTPSVTASTADTPDPSDPVTAGDLTIEGVSQGPPPRVPYLAADGDTWNLVEPDGTTRPLDRKYDTFAPMGDGLVGTAYLDDETVAFVLDGDLRVVSRLNVSGGSLAVTPDGQIVGWLGRDGGPHVVERGGTQEWDLPLVQDADSLAALVSDGTTCKEGEGGQGCAAFVNSADGTRAWSSISHGIVDTVPGVISVGDVAQGGAMVAMTSVSDEGSCWGRFQSFKRKPVWETCDYTLFDFSPSGSRILAGPAYLDGFGQGISAVLDDDGQVLAEWHSRGQSALLHTIWEDDDHVLAMVFEDDAWAVLRLGIADGSVELAVPPAPDTGGDYPFVLPTV